MLKDLWQLVKDTAVYGFGKAAFIPLGLITLPIFTRVFDPGQYSIIELTNTIIAFMILFLGLGMESAASRSYFDAVTGEHKKKVVSTGLWLLVACNSMAVIVLLFGSRWISSSVFKIVDYWPVLMIAFATIPFGVLSSYAQNIMRLRFWPWKFTAVALLSAILTAGLSLFFVLGFGMGLPGYFLGFLIGSAAALPLAMYFVKRDIGFEFSMRMTKEMLSFGAPLVLTSLAYNLLSLSDRFFLAKFATLTDVGLYSIAIRVQSILLFVYTVFALAWTPFFYRIYSESETKVKEITRRVFKYLLLGVFLLAVFLTTFGHELLRILTTEKYFAADIAIGPLCIGAVAFISMQVTIVGIGVRRKTKYAAVLAWLAAMVNLVLNFLLVPRWGILGAAVANALSFSFLTIGCYIISQRLYPIAYDKAALLKICFIGLVFVVAGSLIRMDGLLLSLAVKAGFMLLFVAMIFIFKVFDSAEMGYIRQWSGRLVGKK